MYLLTRCLIIYVVYCFSAMIVQSQNDISTDDFIKAIDKVAVVDDLNMILRNLPKNYQEIDNVLIRVLHEKINPRNATDCINALPDLLNDDYLKNMNRVYRSNLLSNLITWYEEIFSPVTVETYLELCKKLKNNKQNNNLIYYVVNKMFLKIPVMEREKYVREIMALMPLEKGVNGLIIGSFYQNLGKDNCWRTIDQLKKQHASDVSFVEEIEETKAIILYNETHPQTNNPTFEISN